MDLFKREYLFQQMDKRSMVNGRMAKENDGSYSIMIKIFKILKINLKVLLPRAQLLIYKVQKLHQIQALLLVVKYLRKYQMDKNHL